MKKIIGILLLFIFVLFAGSNQNRYETAVLFGSVNDTIPNITKQDTLCYRPWINGSAGNWHEMTNYISAAEKTGETNQEYDFADHDDWMGAEYFDFKIKSGEDANETITSTTFIGAWLNGAITGILIPDTSGTNTTYTLKVGGN